MIDQAVLANAWLDYKKACDLVPHSWIMETLEMIGAAENVKHSLRRVCEELENAVKC